MYAFQLSIPFPGVVPAFLNIVQNRKILHNDLIILFFFLAPIPAYHVSHSLLPQQSGGLYTETYQLPDPVKRQTTNLQKVKNTERVFPSQLTEIFLNLTLQTVKRLQKMD